MIQKVKSTTKYWGHTGTNTLYHIRGSIIERFKYTVYMLACAKFAYYTEDNYIVKGIISQYICSEKCIFSRHVAESWSEYTWTQEWQNNRHPLWHKAVLSCYVERWRSRVWVCKGTDQLKRDANNYQNAALSPTVAFFPVSGDVGPRLTCVFHLVVVYQGQGLHGITDRFPFQQSWSATVTGSSATWWFIKDSHHCCHHGRFRGSKLTEGSSSLPFPVNILTLTGALTPISSQICGAHTPRQHLSLNCFAFCTWNHLHILVQTRSFPDTDLREKLWGDVWLSVEEVQDVAGMLNTVFGRLLRGGESVVPGAMEVLETAWSIF